MIAGAYGCSSSAQNVETAPPAPNQPAPEETKPADDPTPVARACYLDEDAARNAKAKPFRPPNGKYLAKCSKETINDLLICTHKSDAEAPNDPHCQALVPQKACIACIFSDRGAILDVKFPNIPGCIALATGDLRTDGCGAAYNDWQTCQKAGCASCFSQVSVPKEDQQACVQDAVTKVCDEKARFDMCGDLQKVPEYKQFCEQPATLTDEYLGRLYNYFCGTQGAF